MILLIDNYDSFSYNLYQLVGSLEPDIRVIRNDAMTAEEIEALQPDAILLSPGPGRPAQAGVCEEVVRRLGSRIPVLGVCLGHQGICEAFGAQISYARQLMHGKQSIVRLDPECPLFRGLPEEIPVARYHSLSAVRGTMPECLKIVAQTEDGEIMAVQHREYPVFGVQFHPESVLTPDGKTLLRNFLVETGAAKHPLPLLQKERRIFMLEAAIKKLGAGESLSYDEAYGCMDEIMSGAASQIQATAFLCLLARKGETIEEITACAAGMRDKAIPVVTHCDTLEIVGTGGDGSNSFNISSTAALVIAAAGQPVAKHGNRAASSRSGAADCLEALGVNVHQEPEQAVRLLDEVGLCFFFAQKYHTAMKYVGPIRKELGIRTVFNILGPLTNPARPAYQVLGVYSEEAVEPLADALAKLGVRRGLSVYARDGMDEISSSGETVVCEFGEDGRRTYVITPEEFGLARCRKSDLTGGTPEDNASITRSILGGEQGPRRDTVVMNAGAGLYICGKASSMADGIALAQRTIDSGAALKTLEAYIASSNR